MRLKAPSPKGYIIRNFRLERPEVERTEWQDPPDPDAATIADEAPGEDLRAYVHAWRAGSDLMAAELARNAQFSLKRPVQTLSAACEALMSARLSSPAPAFATALGYVAWTWLDARASVGILRL